jgi:hypothetical protein
MKGILLFVLMIIGLVILVGVGSVLLVLTAYGAGRVMIRILPSGSFTPFEATLLNLVGVLIVGLAVLRIVSAATNTPFLTEEALEDDEDDWEDEDWEEDWEEEELEEDETSSPSQDDAYPGIPRWRQPIKKVDFSNVKPDDRCPCGSGRKYKNCHGYKAKS